MHYPPTSARQGSLIAILAALLAVMFWKAFFRAFRTGIASTIRSERPAKRKQEPVRFWTIMVGWALAFLLCLLASVVFGGIFVYDLIWGG
jgi:hypothetical protein